MFGLKKGKRKRRMKNFEFSWHEGKFFDYWFFVHGLTGVAFGLGAHILGVNFEYAVLTAVVAMITFEISENIFGNTISEIEHPINSLVDILEGVLIFYLTFKVSGDLSLEMLIALFILVIVSIVYLRKKAHNFISKKRWWKFWK